MISSRRNAVFLVFLLLVGLLLTACAAGNARFTEASPAGFWNGLWHGFILVIAFIISLFSDTVTIYESHNSGNWYNLGFVLGAMVMLGGSSRAGVKGARGRKHRDDWEELGERIEDEVLLHIEEWLEKEGGEASDLPEEGEGPSSPDMGDENWSEIARKVEVKLKRRLREWADKE